ncbi:YdcF family protein [Herbaspirillum sp. RTI4]|uniref:YdcF family protein n=1 Tax=Herbaspirillum sp. RTI4 TaxID=3048640 RepID=UPI002AB40F4D|nr:YdcF family protein [Herbaspirillum sp. RTI4]MDY7578065.1 YdcF family protein [Herbaspirillum sp. RTI4]MEA9983416.1 YdcF family protein [Herbaspirillum sp. RTI4]
MTTIFFLLLTFFATIFHTMKWRFVSRTLFASIFILFMGIGCGIVPQWLLEELQSPIEEMPPIRWGSVSNIILLGGGTEKLLSTGKVEAGTFGYGRIAKTAALYTSCKKSGGDCSIFISGGDPQHHGISEAAVYGKYLQNLGIKQSDLILDTESMNTWQNAKNIARMLPRDDWNNLWLVTSGLHLRRSLLYFSHYGKTPIPVRADYISAIMSWVPISYNFLVTDLALHEYAGIGRYWLYHQLGLNNNSANPGDI